MQLVCMDGPDVTQAHALQVVPATLCPPDGSSLQIKLFFCKTRCWFKCFIWRYLLHKHCFDSVLLKGLRTFCLRSLRQRKRKVVLETATWSHFQWTESIYLWKQRFDLSQKWLHLHDGSANPFLLSTLVWKKKFNISWLLHKFNKLLDNIVILQIWIIINVG